MKKESKRGYVEDLVSGRAGDDVPTHDLLTGWRNACDEIVNTLALGGNKVDEAMVPSRMLFLGWHTMGVMRRAAALGVQTPQLAKLRAVLSDLRATNPALTMPVLFVDWKKAGPTILPRLRVAIRRARADVDAIALADARPKPRKAQQHAKGSLDERAVARAKQWQRDPARQNWTVADLAKTLGTYPANLIGQPKGKPRCPVFFDYWQDVQAQRAREKLTRHGRLERGRQ